MGGLKREDQSYKEVGLANFFFGGFAETVQILGRILAAPRPARIGLSGLLLWVGIAGVCLADQARAAARDNEKPAENAAHRLGRIDSPFNTTGYLVELAAKMKSSEVGSAILGESALDRSRPTSPSTNGPAAGPSNGPIIRPPAAPGPLTTHTKWFDSGNPVAPPARPSKPAPATTRVVWQGSDNQPAAKQARPERSFSTTTWLLPEKQNSGAATPSQPAPRQVLRSTSEDREVPTPTGSQPSMNHTRWLTPSPTPAPIPAPQRAAEPRPWPTSGGLAYGAAARPQPPTAQASPPSESRQGGPEPVPSAPSFRHTKWLTPTRRTPRTPPPQPVVEPRPWPRSGGPRYGAAARPQPPTAQASPLSESQQGGPEPAPSAPSFRHTKWLTPSSAPRTPPQPVAEPRPWPRSSDQAVPAPAPTAQPAPWPSPANDPLQLQTPPLPTASSAPWAAPPAGGDQTAQAPAPTNGTWPPSGGTTMPDATTPRAPIGQVAPPTPDRQAVQARAPQAAMSRPPAIQRLAPKRARPKPVTDQAMWLSPENQAAKRALAKMGMLDDSQTEAGAEAATGQMPSVAKRAPQLTPRDLGPGTAVREPQLRLLSGEVLNTEMTLPGTIPSYAATDISQAKHFYEHKDPKEPWSLGTDLDKYREHALREGSRDFGQSLGKALERIGLAVEDTTNVFTLGYASDRAEPFRGNDGKGLLDEPGRVPQQAGETIISLGDGLYSLADLVALDSLPDHEKHVYSDNHPIVRPLLFTGRAIGGVWKTTEEIGNAVTWGYFDNVTGAVGMVIEDVIEVLKHAGQAVTNLARVPVQLISGNDPGADKALDWVLLVPLEFASNVLEMKGIANTADYETAFADKGVIGSMLEFGGSTFIVYRVVDEVIDELDERSSSNRQSSKAADGSPAEPSEPPIVEEPPPPPPPPTGTSYLWWWNESGGWVELTVEEITFTP